MPRPLENEDQNFSDRSACMPPSRRASLGPRLAGGAVGSPSPARHAIPVTVPAVITEDDGALAGSESSSPPLTPPPAHTAGMSLWNIPPDAEGDPTAAPAPLREVGPMVNVPPECAHQGPRDHLPPLEHASAAPAPPSEDRDDDFPPMNPKMPRFASMPIFKSGVPPIQVMQLRREASVGVEQVMDFAIDAARNAFSPAPPRGEYCGETEMDEHGNHMRPDLPPLEDSDDFDFLEILAEGTYGDVRRALDKREKGVSPKAVAIKVIHTLPPFRFDTTRKPKLSEYDVLKVVEHEHVIGVFGHYSFDGYAEALILEYAPDGDLFYLLQRKEYEPRLHAKNYMVNLADALDFIHTAGFVHNDVMLVFGDKIKLCDFGLSGWDGEQRCGPALGTRAYMAPELLTVPPGGKFNLHGLIDMFSFGIVLHIVIFGTMPWLQADVTDPNYNEFERNKVTFTAKWSKFQISSWMKFLLEGLFEDRNHRIDASDAAQMIRSEWFEDGEAPRDQHP